MALDAEKKVELSRYRMDKAYSDLREAKKVCEMGMYGLAINRSYYAIFHSMRSVLCLDDFDSKKHSGIIAEFRRRYIKEGLISKDVSRFINEAFTFRNGSDYEDFYLVSKDMAVNQIDHAEQALKEVTEFVFPKWIALEEELNNNKTIEKNNGSLKHNRDLDIGL